MDGLSAAMRVRDARMANPLSRNVGGPLPDMRWDALFGALQQKQQQATNAGQQFRFLPSTLNVSTIQRR